MFLNLCSWEKKCKSTRSLNNIVKKTNDYKPWGCLGA